MGFTSIAPSEREPCSLRRLSRPAFQRPDTSLPGEILRDIPGPARVDTPGLRPPDVQTGQYRARWWLFRASHERDGRRSENDRELLWSARLQSGGLVYPRAQRQSDELGPLHPLILTLADRFRTAIHCCEGPTL